MVVGKILVSKVYRRRENPKVESKVVQAKNETPVVEKAGKTADGDNKKNAK